MGYRRRRWWMRFSRRCRERNIGSDRHARDWIHYVHRRHSLAGRHPTESMSMKIAIIGGVSQERFFSGQRDGWHTWGLNAIRPPWVRKWSKMFNLHRFKHLERDCPWYVDADTAWSKRNPEVPMVVID